jgi:hypothetical protein
MKLFDLQHKLFSIVLFISYILIVAVYLGLSSSASSYLDTIDYYLRIYICLFLIWRFNPFRPFLLFAPLINAHSGAFSSAKSNGSTRIENAQRCRTITFTELDRKIVFSAGLLILTTTTLNKYIVQATEKLASISS